MARGGEPRRQQGFGGGDGDGRRRAEAGDRPVGRACRSMGGGRKPRAAGNACATLAGTTPELSVM
nr:unnamed protein product [Digitaria exilis]